MEGWVKKKERQSKREGRKEEIKKSIVHVERERET